ncbi:MAG: 30S ribosomal protein S12 methylthiotransferase RimO [Acidimicrobiales bacterium]|nr:30S ribosomal protein S12 methylthiotransferase RimO [Acidimicrobiales bacterium]
MPQRFWVETLGCPKNQVDSEKLVGQFVADGLTEAQCPEDADLVVVNTCAFIEPARQESIETILALSDARREGARLVVTGCLAQRYGDELAEALPEIDAVAGFGRVPVMLSPGRGGPSVPPRLGGMDLLDLPRPPARAPWAYVKVAEGCDRRCGFCAIPSFRGPQRSRSIDDIVAEVESLGVREVVLVAQDLASFGRDQGKGERAIVPLVRAVAERVDWVRLLYLYPSELSDELVAAVLDTGVPYFDLSLQHVSAPLLRRMRRWGDAERFVARIAEIRSAEPEAVFRSNFIVGYPGETEEDHDQLLEFLREVRLDWCGFFAYSEEPGTFAETLEPKVPTELVTERLAELSELQDEISRSKRDELVGSTVTALVDGPGRARSHREAPEIDGVIEVPDWVETGSFVEVRITAAVGPDLIGIPTGAAGGLQ